MSEVRALPKAKLPEAPGPNSARKRSFQTGPFEKRPSKKGAGGKSTGTGAAACAAERLPLSDSESPKTQKLVKASAIVAAEIGVAARETVVARAKIDERNMTNPCAGWAKVNPGPGLRKHAFQRLTLRQAGKNRSAGR